MPPVQPPRLRWRAVLIVLAGALTYWNSLSGPFVFDDRGSILDNHTIEKLWDPSVFSAPHETPVAGRPVVNVSFALNYALGGRDVRGYHAGNVAVHLLCALLVFGIVRRTLQLPANQARFGRAGVDMAFAAALIWAVHPLNSEVVNYLTQRTESLMALFYLLVLYAGIRAIDKRVAGRRRLGWEAIAVVSSALGMACKESMATVPLVILLYDRVFVFDSLRRALRDRWPFYTALAATWLVLAAMMWTAPRTLSAGFAAHDA
ncbi:MAG TPA: glycosyltransferase family 39 protein, partial [Vicinamibacterales bacterium]|nr:glycosyltransferase family 39 protein [Vicinamibacterales bacterium]